MQKREKKYRAWDSDAAEFTYSHIEQEEYIWGFEKGQLKAWAIVTNPGSLHEPPYPESIELEPPDDSTGLHDKNSKEIWEGDIVVGFGKKRGEIVWSTEDAAFMIKGWENWPIRMNPIGSIEVIGNRFENPELLD